MVFSELAAALKAKRRRAATLARASASRCLHAARRRSRANTHAIVDPAALDGGSGDRSSRALLRTDDADATPELRVEQHATARCAITSRAAADAARCRAREVMLPATMRD